jgi:hypothetical protein
MELTSGMFTDMLSSITANLGVLVPVGIGLMALLIGVRLIPKVVKRFV